MNKAQERRKAVVVGGSLAGLFAGLHLMKNGWDVEIFERVPEKLDGRGAGIVTHQELFDALAAVGIDPSDNLGVEVPGRVAFAADGSIIERCDKPQLLTAWGRLFELLLRQFPESEYHRGEKFERFEDDGQKVTVRFTSGRVAVADLLVAADGVRSSVRTQVEPQSQPVYAGYVAWRGLVNETDLSERARHEMAPYFAFSLPEGEQMLGYPVAGEANSTEPGHCRYNFVWYRPADQNDQLPWLLTDTSGNMNGASIAPTMIRDEVIAEMRQGAQTLLSPQFAELVEKTKQPFIQPIYDLTIGSMAHGRVAIIGDAAFVARPHVGMGVTKAAADAVALAECLLERSVPEALQLFHHKRHPVDLLVVDHARRLGAYMQAQASSEEERQAAERYRTPSAVLRETASSGFLSDI
ncbi:monooxygenase [Mycobacterium malmoense]|nr:monooxygenase [Mycobacterium malmoense]